MHLFSSLLRAIQRSWHELLLACVIVLAVALLGIAFFVHGRQVLTAQLKERLMGLASVAALQMDAQDLSVLETADDYRRPEWKNVVSQLLNIRMTSKDLVYVYILGRAPQDPQAMIFLADSHSLHPYAKVDLDDNGIVDSADELIAPGSVYDDVPEEAFGGFAGPLTNHDLYTDQWGTVLSGYAPIKDREGNAIAIMALDIRADDYVRAVQGLFSPLSLALVFALGAVIAVLTVVYVWKRKVQAWRKIDSERSELLKLTFHQLGSPLTILKWSLELLREQINSPELKAVVSQHVENADEVIRRMNDILEVLKVAERIHGGTLQYRLISASLSEVIRTAVDQMRPELSAKSQTVDLNLTATENPIQLDPILIGRVVSELVGNASIYSPAGSVLSVRTSANHSWVTVEISDVGCGISPADLKRVFHEFVRGADAGRYKPDGNGLGLYIAKGIVERGGGKMWISSTQGRGTTVTFTLPLLR